MNEAAQVIIAIGIACAGGASTVMLVWALASRIAGPRNPGGRTLSALREELEQLRTEHDEMRHRLEQVDELQSRVDFAERVIAQSKARDALPGAR